MKILYIYQENQGKQKDNTSEMHYDKTSKK